MPEDQEVCAFDNYCDRTPECCEVAWRACFNLVGTWCTLGGLHPQDMVNEAVKEYFKKVFHLEKQAKGNGQI